MSRRLILILFAAMGVLVFCSYGGGPFSGGAGNRTGSAGSSAGCSGGSSGCHSSATTSAILRISLLDNNVPVAIYIPGKTYRVLLSETIPGTTRPRFGFQVSCVKAGDGATQAGTFSIGSTPNIAVYNAAPQLIEHTYPIAGKIVGPDVLDTVSFLWTAPATSIGKVRFYAALNAVNFDGDSTGDQPNTATMEADAVPAGINTKQEDRLSIYPNPATDVLHVKLREGKSAQVSISDITGRVITPASSIIHNEMAMDISGLLPGGYFIIVSESGISRVAPFIKK